MKTVRTFRANIILIIAVALLFAVSSSNAESPLKKLRLPFQKKQIEADPNATYELTESNGPWLVMAASFVGEEGEVQARELMMEIRRELNLPAYVYKRHFDFSGEVTGRDFQLDKDDPERVIRRRMKHAQDASFEETAVLVGDYPGLDDPQAQKVLELIKYAKPESIPTGENATNHQRMGMIRGSVAAQVTTKTQG